MQNCLESAIWIVHHFLRVIPTGSQVFHTFATVFRLLPDCFRLFPGCFSLQPRLTETFAIPTETLVFGVTFDYSICFRLLIQPCGLLPLLLPIAPSCLHSLVPTGFACICPTLLTWFLFFAMLSPVYRILVHPRSNMDFLYVRLVLIVGPHS